MSSFMLYGHQLLTFIFHLFCWIITIVTITPVLPIVIALLIWKFLILEPIARLWTSNKIRRFGVTDTLFSTDLYWEKPLCSLAVVYFLNGNLNIKEFCKEFQTRILEARGPTSNLIYENLTSIPSNILGYYFWKKDDEFKLENHIIQIDQPITETELKDLLHQWLASPFPKQKPLWDIRILTNYKAHPSSEFTVTVILPRLHHTVGDGYTFMKMMDRLAGVVTPTPTPSEAKHTVLEQIKIAFRLPSIVGNFAWKNLDILFKRDLFSQPHKNEEYFISWITMPLEKWRNVRRAAKVHFSSVGLSLFTGALTKYERSINSNASRKQKQNLHALSVLPRPGHPNDRMANHARIGIMSIPLQTIQQDSMDHILKTEQEFHRVTEEGEPILFQWIGVPLISLLPSWIFRPMNKIDFGTRIVFTGAMSTLNKEIQICKNPVLAVVPLTGPLHPHMGIVGFIGNFQQTAILTVLGRADICPSRAAVEQICSYVKEGLEQLTLNPKNIADAYSTVPKNVT